MVSVCFFAYGYTFFLPFASKIALNFEAKELAESYAKEMLEIAKQGNDDWNKGNAIFSANIILGRLALQQGDKIKAIDYLLKAGKTHGSPQLNSFGPGMGLAKDLLENGEKDAVILYLEHGKIDHWKAQIQKGIIPNFDMNSNYY